MWSGFFVISRVVPLCPIWPPGFLPEEVRRLFVLRNISLEGGLLLLRLFLFNLSRASLSKASNWLMRKRSALFSCSRCLYPSLNCNIVSSCFKNNISSARVITENYHKFCAVLYFILHKKVQCFCQKTGS